MKKKHLMTALLCTFCLAMAPMAAMAEETELVTEAVTEAVEEETAAEEASAEEVSTEEEASTEEEETEPLVRPEYKALDYVTLGQYKGLTVVPESTEATEEEIDAQIRAYTQQAGALTETTEGTVAEGDTVVIDYEGKKDGVAFDGGTAKDQELEIGSNTFIDGFESGLIGVTVGETVDLNLTFPENYFNTDLAGQEVVFTVTVHAIKTMPEVTDDLVNTITSGEYTDVASYREYIRESIEATKESTYESQIQADLMTQVANICEINEYPQEMIDYGVANMQNYYKEMAEMYSMEYADFLSAFLGMTEEDFNTQVELAATQNLQLEMYLKAIAENEGIEVTEEDYAAGCQEYADIYGYETVEEFEAAYDKDTIEISILQEMVLDFLVENAVIVEETEVETEVGTEAETGEAAEEATKAETAAETETAAEEETEAATEIETEVMTEA